MKAKTFGAALGAVLLSSVPTSAEPPTPDHRLLTEACGRLAPAPAVARHLRKAYSTPTTTKATRLKSRRLMRCVRDPAQRPRLRDLRRELKAKRDARFYWERQFARLAPADQAWARSIGACESGNNPATATGNGFYGAMQWVPSTWAAAGGRGSPAAASLHEQWVRAVYWRNRAGTMQWPACSLKLGYG